ncbi:MAG: twin-arginine translocase subunit TatC, partial [Gammaproteobacteria bacterium]|nr:twin-arginine translocase subunit TatC [Gammaproteobacteria bacterium]
MDAENAGEATLIEHLVELRTRLLRAVAGLMVVFLGLLPFANRLYGWLARPLLEKMPEGAHLIAVEVASPFFAPLKLAFFIALVVTMPWLLYQLWAFVAPGLYKREKRLAMPLLVSAVTLFYA